jgi:hypothetical protein
MQVQLPATLKRYEHLIDDFEDDRGNQNGYWVYLKYGWRTIDDVVHQIHEMTLRECALQLQCVTECDCRECKFRYNDGENDI